MIYIFKSNKNEEIRIVTNQSQKIHLSKQIFRNKRKRNMLSRNCIQFIVISDNFMSYGSMVFVDHIQRVVIHMIIILIYQSLLCIIQLTKIGKKVVDIVNGDFL